MNHKTKVAIIGSGNIGTDLMIKVLQNAKHLEMAAMVGIDPDSDGLARAAGLGVAVTHEGVEGLMALPGFDDIEIVFDATSAKAHVANAAKLAPLGKRLIDLTPAAIGPFVVPAVNLEENLAVQNVNMGGLRVCGREGLCGTAEHGKQHAAYDLFGVRASSRLTGGECSLEHGHPGVQGRQPDHLPRGDREAAEQGDPVRRGVRLLAPGRGDPGRTGAAAQGRHEPVVDGAHRIRGGGGQVGMARPRLVAVDLLQREDIGIERGDGVPEDAELDLVVRRRTPVEDVEGGQSHR